MAVPVSSLFPLYRGVVTLNNLGVSLLERGHCYAAAEAFECAARALPFSHRESLPGTSATYNDGKLSTDFSRDFQLEWVTDQIQKTMFYLHQSSGISHVVPPQQQQQQPAEMPFDSQPHSLLSYHSAVKKLDMPISSLFPGHELDEICQRIAPCDENHYQPQSDHGAHDVDGQFVLSPIRIGDVHNTATAIPLCSPLLPPDSWVPHRSTAEQGDFIGDTELRRHLYLNRSLEMLRIVSSLIERAPVSTENQAGSTARALDGRGIIEESNVSPPDDASLFSSMPSPHSMEVNEINESETDITFDNRSMCDEIQQSQQVLIDYFNNNCSISPEERKNGVDVGDYLDLSFEYEDWGSWYNGYGSTAGDETVCLPRDLVNKLDYCVVRS